MKVKRIVAMFLALAIGSSIGAIAEGVIPFVMERGRQAPVGGVLLLKSNEYRVWIQSVELVTTYDGEEILHVNVWVHNPTEFELEISFEEVKINGASFISDGLRNCGTGDYPLSFGVWSEEGYSAAQRQALHNPRSFSAWVEIYEGFNWDLLSAFETTADLSGLAN